MQHLTPDKGKKRKRELVSDNVVYVYHCDDFHGHVCVCLLN